MKSCRIIASGIVQGVFYRAFVKEQADALGLKGFARNLADGRVEAIAEGDDEKIKELIKRLRKGPSGSRVDSLEIKWQEPQNFSRFEIVR